MELFINNQRNFEDSFLNRTAFGKITLVVCLGVIVSCYFFPFEFTFLPNGLNTKIMLAVLAIPVLGYNLIKKGSVKINNKLLAAIIFALAFSLIGYISVDINNSVDLSYANYIVSFSTWLLSAYLVCVVLYEVYGYLNFELLFNYLIAVCVLQSIIALLIDYNPVIKNWVDTYISQAPVADVKFLNEVNRLYGIGAAVDVAGTRFSIVLLGLAATLNNIRRQDNKLKQVLLYWSAFLVIAVIGNMISRTTIVGVGMAIIYLFLTSDVLQSRLTITNIKSFVVIVVITMFLVLVTIYFYHTDIVVQKQLRFAFEGFFNWVEKGKWYTGSTDRLNSVMWIWPESADIKTWLIGKATFDDWYAVGTDIGYCRFIFYNGLLGLVTFSMFFVYNAWACDRLMPGYTLFFCFLLSLSFVIWSKVATDLFIIYALFYNVGLISSDNTEAVMDKERKFVEK